MRKIFILLFKSVLPALLFAIPALAQEDSAFIKRIPADTASQKLNMDATYNRPFLTAGKAPVALGGYAEANTHYASTDGVTEGLSFQARRLTLFFSSSIEKRIKFFSEIEFEDGTKETNIEFAALDISFHPLLNLRGGIILNPIGAFNQNHDGPKWDFIERPISATAILPATLSNAGFGLHGKHVHGNWIVGYETYLTNGFDDKIISNSDNRTSLSAGKSDPEKFEESNSGMPLFTGKLALRHRKAGELGLSYISGIYNKWREDGLVIDDKRSAGAVAVDINTSLLKNRINITAEAARVFADVPDTYSQAFGKKQFGAFADVVWTIKQGTIFGWEKSKINLGVRLEYADYNLEKFRETGDDIADHIWAVVPAIAFRPVGATVLRFNYRYEEQTDLLGNPPAKTGAVQLGFSTYF